MLDDNLADITVAISSVSLEIDLCHDDRHSITRILTKATGVTEPTQRILSQLAPSASLFHDEE